MKSFEQRLNDLMRCGNLRVADLARWFGRPHATVRGWANGTPMNGTAFENAFIIAALNDLEVRLKRGRGLPVPRMSLRARILYMGKLKNGQAGN